MMIQDVTSVVLPLAIAGLAGVAGQFLNSPTVKAWIAATTDKLGAEAAALTSNASNSNNQLVRMMVGIAMSYAETHEAEILTKFKSKAEFVIARVTADPRFASLGIPLDTVELILEDLWESYFQHSGVVDQPDEHSH